MRILIVEDERESREGLALVLEKIVPEAGIYTAAGGEEALKTLAGHSMDLVFLDIRMPGMDGLTLLEKIREHDASLPVAILSGYDQFGYAQRAIRLGAMDYITKPYTQQAIERVIARVRSDLDRQNEKSDFISLDFASWGINPKLYADLLARHLELKENVPYFGRLCLLRMHHAGNEPQENVEWLIRQIRALKLPDLHIAFSEYDGLYILILLSSRKLTMPDAPFMDACIRKAYEKSGVRFCCAMTAPQEELLSGIQTGLTHCKTLMEYAFYLQEPCVIVDGSPAVDTKKRLDPSLLEELKGRILKGEQEETQAALDAIYQDVRREPFMPVQRFMFTLHGELINLMKSSAKDKENQHMELADRAGQLARRCLYINDFFDTYRQLVLELVQEAQASSEDYSSSIVRRCLSYLEENYGNPELTQEEMARQFHFSAGYFGNMFKKDQGESFVRYLNRLRIKKAQELLVNSSLKVYEIAEKTGFSNVNYFIRVFNQQTQMSPNRYRVLYGERRNEA